MGASGSLLRAVGSSSAGRYALTAPTARALTVRGAAGIRLVELAGDWQARALSLVGDEGSEEEMLRLSFFIDPHPSQLTLLASAEASSAEALVSRYTRGGIVVDGVVTSRPLLAAPGDDLLMIAPRPRALAPGPHAEASSAEIQAGTAEEASEEGFLPRPWSRFYGTAPRPQPLAFAAAEEASEEDLAAGSRSYIPAPRPHHFSILPADEASEVEIPPSSRARSATPTASPFFGTGMGLHRPRIFFTTGYGHHLIRPKTGLPAVLTRGLRSYAKPPQRHMELPSFQLSQRRGWCWTPWQPNRPKPLETKPKGLEDIVQLLQEVNLSKEERAKLKEVFLDMFYSSEHPEGSDVKLDVLLHGQALTNRILMQVYGKVEKKPRKWLTITIRGRKIDLGAWIPTLVSFFLK